MSSGASSCAAAATAPLASSSSRRLAQRSHSKQLPLLLRASRVATRSSGQDEAITGVVFQSLQLNDVKDQLVLQEPRQSLARSNYDSRCEAAINEQINIEYNVSYIYHALFSYFDRDDVALPGLAAYFKSNSDEEREHAEDLMKFQTLRGGRVQLQTIVLPDFGPMAENPTGDALVAMELALALEKLNYEKLLAVHAAADEASDPQMTDFIEEFLGEQVEAINTVAKKVAQLRAIGPNGYGVWAYDQKLLESSKI